MELRYIFALDSNGQRIHIRDATSGAGYVCPCCGSPMVARKGQIVSHHFAHKANFVCDSWYGNKGEWHRHMQSLFRDDLQEIVLTVNGVKHIADICLTKPNGQQLVIEFQHSSMSQLEFEKRTAFWKANHRDVLWVFDYTHLSLNAGFRFLPDIEIGADDCAFQWVRPAGTFGSGVPKGIHLLFYIKPFVDSEWDLSCARWFYNRWNHYMYTNSNVPLWCAHESEEDQDDAFFLEVQHNDIGSKRLVHQDLSGKYYFDTPYFPCWKGVSGYDVGRTDQNFMDYMLALTRTYNAEPFSMG